MAKILCIETATTNCSVALSENGSVIALKEDNSKEYSHSERLHGFVELVLNETNTHLKDLDAIAVSKGPGSYTGLRIGVSTAKGLCYAADKPLLATSTLRTLALSLKDSYDFIIPMLDARRMEVYAAIFDGNGSPISETKAEILNAESFHDILGKGTVAFVGNGVEKFRELCDHSNANFINRLPSANEMATLAFEKFKIGEWEDVAYFEPYYLKDFIITK